MNRKLLIVILLSLVMVTGGCVVNVQSDEAAEKDPIGEMDEIVSEAEYRKITPEEAKEMMIEGNIILDVRTQEEYEDGHIQGALLLPVDVILDGDLEILPDKNQTILVYCRSGNRSSVAANALVDEGYMAVYDFGGINDWPYEIVR